MSSNSITTEAGTTVSLEEANGETLVFLASPDAPEDMKRTEAGRIVYGAAYQPSMFPAFAMRPNVLRALADLIDGNAPERPASALKAAFEQDMLRQGLYAAMCDVADVNRANGWYESERTFGEDIALLHSEVSEALEAYREHEVLDVTELLCRDASHAIPALAPNGGHVCKPEGVGSELADVFIRLLDTCDRRGINLAAEFERKLAFNATRGHRHGGKNLRAGTCRTA